MLVTDERLDKPDVVARIHLSPDANHPHAIVCWRHIEQPVVCVARRAAIAYLASTVDREGLILTLRSTGVVETPDGAEASRVSIPGPKATPMSDAIEAALAVAPRLEIAGVGSGRLVTTD